MIQEQDQQTGSKELLLPVEESKTRSNTHYTEQEKEFFRKAVREYWNKIPIKELTRRVHNVLKSTRSLGAVQTQLYATFHEMEKEKKQKPIKQKVGRPKAKEPLRAKIGKVKVQGRLDADKKQFRTPIRSILIENGEVIFNF